MRVTRQRAAKAESNNSIHIDNTATEAIDAVSSILDKVERAPLKELSLNVEEVAEAMPPKKKGAKGKGKGRGKKAKTEDSSEDTTQDVQQNVDTVAEVLDNIGNAAASPASEEDLQKKPELQETAKVLVEGQTLVAPPSRAVRQTRRQLALEAEAEREEAQLKSTRDDTSHASHTSTTEDYGTVESVAEPDVELDDDPAVVQSSDNLAEAGSLEQEAKPTQESKMTLAPLEVPSSEVSSRSISQSPSQRSPGTIEALDALEDAMEDITKALTPSKTRSAPEFKVNGHTPTSSTSSVDAPVPAPNLARTPRDAKSLKENVPPQSAAKKTASTATTKSCTQKHTTGRVPTTANLKPKGTGEVVDYLASKRRPVSVLFPTPPPLAKSTRAPTKASFTLPGEAVAAKLKAAREARLQKDAAEGEKSIQKKPVVRARPIPKSVNVVPVVKQTAASRAREAIVNGTLPDMKLATRTPSIDAAAATKRQSITMSRVRTASVHIAPVAKKDVPGVSIPPPRPAAITTIKARVPSTLTSSVSSTAPRIISTNLKSSVTGPVSGAPVSATEAAAQRVKGREVFNRDRHEKEEREREKRGKEEAAKRARAEAAERGRIASREWAEKQKKRAELAVATQATSA